MIVGIRDGETERIWRGAFSRALPHDIQSTALRKLRMLNNAKVLQDLAVPPNNQLEALKGDRAGQHSIRINRQCRIYFVCTTGGPDRVEIVDYHQANSQPHARRGSAAGVHRADGSDAEWPCACDRGAATTDQRDRARQTIDHRRYGLAAGTVFRSLG